MRGGAKPSPGSDNTLPLRGLKLHRLLKISTSDTWWVPIGYELLEKQNGPPLPGGTFMLMSCVACCNAVAKSRALCKNIGHWSDLAHGQLELGSPKWALSDLDRFTWES
jgi:hypothetical protein